MSGLLCAGNVQIALLNDDGSTAGFMRVKNTVQLEFAQGDSNEKTRVSKKIEDFGQALDTVYTPGATNLTVGVDEHDADIAGMAFRGAVSKLTAAAVTAKKVTIPVIAGMFMPIGTGVFDITAVKLTSPVNPDKPTDPVKTYEEGKDYELDAGSGMVLKLDGSTIGDSVDVTYSQAAYSALEVAPGTKPTINTRIWGRMKNLANGKAIFVDVPKVALYPSTPVDWLADSFAVQTFGGPIQALPGQKPYTVRYVQ